MNLKEFAIQIRIETLKCLAHRGFGHVGGSLSIADTLAVLYGGIMKINPKNPKDENRDYLVVSKGHAGPAVQATLDLKGYFPIEWLNTMSEGGTKLPSHCDRLRTSGVDVTTGSLGQGVSVAAGIAHAFKLRNKSNKVYCILGDGEIQEGQVWETVLFANQYNLNNLICFVDWNKKQIDGTIDEVMTLLDIEEKFRSFGWYTDKVDGSNPKEIYNAILNAQKPSNQKPIMILLDGIKGSGVKIIEDLPFNHLITFTKELLEKSLEDLNEQIQQLKKEEFK